MNEDNLLKKVNDEVKEIAKAKNNYGVRILAEYSIQDGKIIFAEVIEVRKKIKNLKNN